MPAQRHGDARQRLKINSPATWSFASHNRNCAELREQIFRDDTVPRWSSCAEKGKTRVVADAGFVLVERFAEATTRDRLQRVCEDATQ